MNEELARAVVAACAICFVISLLLKDYLGTKFVVAMLALTLLLAVMKRMLAN